LQLLLPHDGAAPVLRGDVTVVALDRSEPHAVLAGRPDGVDRHAVAGEAMLLLQRLLRLPGVQSFERGGIPDFDGVVVDIEVRELLRLAQDHDGVVARVLERGAEKSVGLRGRGAVGERAARDDRESPRPPDGKPRKRSGSEDEAIVGMVPVHLGPNLVVQNSRTQSDAAETVAHLLGSPGLGPYLPRGEVHAKQFPGIAPRGRRWCGRLLRGAFDCCGWAHFTITDWGSSGECEGRPRTVSGRRRDTVRVARNAGLTSEGFARRCAFQAERSAPAYTRPLSMPTSLVVQMSAAGPQMIPPVR